MIHSQLVGWQVKAEKTMRPRDGADGEPEIVEVFLLTFREPATGNMLQFAFDREQRDALVAGLTGGVYLGNDVPKV